MFDLFRSRDKAMKYLLSGVLGLVALSMVITLIPGYGSAPKAQDTVVAEVGKEPIYAREVQVQLRGMIKNRNLPPEMIDLYVPQLVDQMISERALAYQAKKMGFEVTESEQANAIRSILAQLFPNGTFDRAVYERFLSDQGYTIAQFEENIRKNLLLLKLRNIALEGVVVTPEEVAAEYHRRNDKVAVDYVAIDSSKYKSQVSVTPQEEMDYFNLHRPNFTTNEKRSMELLIADEAKIGSAINVSDNDLRKAYQANLDHYRTPERVKVRHILIKTTDKPKEEVPKLEAKANDLLKQLKGGADFAELAKKNSEDPGSGQKGGDLGWVTRGQMVKNFEDATFSTPVKQLSGVVKTEYGFHILEVLDKEQARVKPFEEVKNDIASEMKRQTVFDRMQAVIEQARAQLTKDPKSAQQIANSLNLIYVKADKIEPNQSVPEVGTNQELQGAIATLRPTEVTPVVQLSPSRLGIAEVTDVEPVRPAEFKEVESKVKEQLQAQKANQLAQEKIMQASSKFNAPGADFKQVAKELGLEIKTTAPFNSDGAAEGIGPASTVAEAFRKPVGAAFGPVNASDKLFFCRVASKESAADAGLAAARSDILLTLKRKKASDRKELFEDGILEQLVKDGVVKKYPDAIKRLEASYRQS